MIETKIVGIKFNSGAHEKLVMTRGGASVVLDRDPGNKFDPNAIRCLIDGHMCGHVPEEVAATLAPELDSGRGYLATLRNYNGLEIELADIR